MRMTVWRSLGMLMFLVALCLAVGQLGVFFTTEQTFAWYNTLIKPHWTPPGLLFPLIWTLLYVMMAIAAWLVWRVKKPGYRLALIIWSVQLLLNGLWTPLFFGHQAIVMGLVVLAILWLCLVMTVFLFYKQSRLAALLMFVYFIGITFAGALNFVIWQMN